MLAELEGPPAVEAEQAISAVLAELRPGARPDVVVDSPPGAGKSNFVIRAAVEFAAAGTVDHHAQADEQVDDLIDRLVPHEGISDVSLGSVRRLERSDCRSLLL